jgi:hypothetical protein
MAKKYVHKDGRVHRVFNTPFTDWEKTPDENLDFPNTVLANDLNDLEAQIGKDYVLIDRPVQEKVEAPRMPIGAILAAMAGMGIPKEKIDQVKAARDQMELSTTAIQFQEKMKATPQLELVKVNQASELQDKMLQEFRVVLATSKQEAEIVANFILSICPDLESELLKLAAQPTKKRIVL